MNQNIKVSEIASKINEIDELLCQLNIENFSTIDKDLMLDKIRSLYEKVLLLKIEKSNVTSVKKEEVVTITAPVFKEEKAVEKPIVKPAPKTVAPELFEKTEIKTEPVIEDKKTMDEYPTLFEVETTPKPIDITTKEPIITNSEKIEKNIPVSASKTISDQYQQNNSQTVSDLMSKSHNEKDISSKLLLKPIKNLKSAISINDRIMFTKELFDNNAASYNEMIDIINGMNNLNEAIEHLGTKIDINDESETVKKIIELVHRRFI